MSQSMHHLQANISLNHDFPKVDQQFRLYHTPLQAVHHSHHIVDNTFNSNRQLLFQFSQHQLEQVPIIQAKFQKFHNKLLQQLSFQPSALVVTPFTPNRVSHKLNPHQSHHSFTPYCHLEAHTLHHSMNLTHQIRLHHKLFTIQPHRPQVDSAANILHRLEILEVMLVL